MLHTLMKGIAPLVALTAAFAIGGCDANVSIDGKKGVPLAELDVEGKQPTGVVLASQDELTVRKGDAFKIDVSGDPAAIESLRFTLSDETVGVMRARDAGKIDGKARVAITLPALEKIVLAGSGTIDTDALSGDAEVVIAGSGTARARDIEATELEVTIAGTGTFAASGRADKLELTLAGSGSSDLAGLSAETAEVTIAGSGNAAFASNGTVKATIMGSGEVSVTGNAKCTVKAMGSGTLRCDSGTVTSNDAPAAPTAPTAPGNPASPATPPAPSPPNAPDAPAAPKAIE